MWVNCPCDNANAKKGKSLRWWEVLPLLEDTVVAQIAKLRLCHSLDCVGIEIRRATPTAASVFAEIWMLQPVTR